MSAKAVFVPDEWDKRVKMLSNHKQIHLKKARQVSLFVFEGQFWIISMCKNMYCIKVTSPFYYNYKGRT